MSPLRPVLLVACAGLVAVFAGCQRQAPGRPVDEKVGDAPAREVSGVNFVVSHDGRSRMRVRAPRMAEYERNDSLITIVSGAKEEGGQRVQVDVFDEMGALSATITADRLQFDGGGERYDADGDVVVVTPEGRRLDGQHLAWYEAERKVRTPGFVRITSPSETVQGYSLEAEEDLSSYSLARVSGQVVVQD